MKPRITKEQADRLEDLKSNKNWDFEHLISVYLSKFKNIENLCLNDLSLEELAESWINGYEIKIPPSPKLENNKMHICFNYFDFNKLKEEDAIYIKVISRFDSFSIEEAKEIRDKIDALIIHYNQYVKQGDKQ